ncbi:conserved hypothetical protein, partial [Ricinus communis]
VRLGIDAFQIAADGHRLGDRRPVVHLQGRHVGQAGPGHVVGRAVLAGEDVDLDDLDVLDPLLGHEPPHPPGIGRTPAVIELQRKILPVLAGRIIGFRSGRKEPYSPNSTRGIRPISEPVRQVARKPAIIAFHTRLSTSWRRWGTSTEKPATFMPTEPMLAKPQSA